MPFEWMADLINFLADLFGTEHLFMVKGVMAVLLVCALCGMVGSLVVGNRMAFFSDALAHCAFAGVALGVLLALFSGFALAEIRQPEARHFITLIMIGFGIFIGLAIAFVREQTGLANDTVIS